MLQVLDTTDAQSDEFCTTGAVMDVMLVSAGGTWELDFQDPDGAWHVLNNETFSETSIWTFPSHPGGIFRFRGGSVGSKIWVSGAFAV